MVLMTLTLIHGNIISGFLDSSIFFSSFLFCHLVRLWLALGGSRMDHILMILNFFYINHFSLLRHYLLSNKY